ncbi:MAG: SDR family oxidoreductase [Devosia sp.]|nr:SDR family oxidoreductase [Devosia sp.]
MDDAPGERGGDRDGRRIRDRPGDRGRGDLGDGMASVWDVDGATPGRCAGDHGGRLGVQAVDVSHVASVSETARSLSASDRPPPHPINNAGIIGRRMRLAELDPDEVDRLPSVNLKGHLLCTRAFLDAHAPQLLAAILNLSSISARSGGTPDNAVLAAAKELAREIRVDALDVDGGVLTPLRSLAWRGQTH